MARLGHSIDIRIHIQSEDWTAGVVCKELERPGYCCTFGTDVPETAEFVIVPNAPAGDSQADRLRPSEIVRVIRNMLDDASRIHRTSEMTVEHR